MASKTNKPADRLFSKKIFNVTEVKLFSWQVIAVSVLALPSVQNNKIWSKVPFPVKMAAHKFDYVLSILCYNATSFLVNFFEGQTHLYYAMVES